MKSVSVPHKSGLIIILLFVISQLHCLRIFENQQMKRLTRNYIQWYAKTFPSQATLMGINKYNGNIENYDADAVDKIIDELNDFSTKMSSIDSSRLSNNQQINYVIIDNNIRRNLLYFKEIEIWKNNPYFYAKNIEDAVEGVALLIEDSTQHSELDFLSRLQKVPRLMEQAKTNLNVQNAYLNECALIELEELQKMFGLRLVKYEEIDSIYLDSLIYFSDIVIDSLTRFQNYLNNQTISYEDTKKPFSKKEYEYFVKSLLTEDVHLDSLKKMVKNDIEKYYQQLVDCSQSYLAEKSMNVKNMQPSQLISILEDEIKSDVPRRDEIVPLCESTHDYIKRFVNEIVNLPFSVDFKTCFQWRESGFLFSKDVFASQTNLLNNEDDVFNYYIKSLPSDNDWMEQYAKLRDYNIPTLKISLLVDGFPLHIYNWQLHRSQFPTASIHFLDQPIVKGLPYYLGFKFLDMGFGGYNLKLKFVLLEKYLRICFQTYVELLNFNEDFTKSQIDSVLAAQNILNKDYMPEMIKQINCSPGNAFHVYWAVRRLKLLEEKCHQKSGSAFNERKFLEQLLSHGPIPITYIEKRVKNSYQNE